MGPAAMARVIHVRGVMVQNAVRFVRETHGDAAHDRVVASLPHEHCATFLGPVRDASWEPAADLVAYMARARDLLAPGDPTFVRRLGFFAGRLERTKGGYRPMVADPSTAMRMGPVIWSSFYDAGRLEVTVKGPREAETRILDFDVSPLLCERSCGAWEGLTGSDEQPATAVEVCCVHRGGDYCRIDVTWTEKRRA